MAAVYFAVGCTTARPIPEISIEDPILQVQHTPGFDYGLSRWARLLHPDWVPEAAWRMLVAADGRVERERLTCDGWRREALRPLTPERRSRLEDLLRRVLLLGMSSGIQGDHSSEDRFVVHFDGQTAEHAVWDADMREMHEVWADEILAVRDALTAWYPPPKKRYCS